MKKSLAILVILLVLVGGVSQVLLPSLVAGQLSSLVKDATKAQQVRVDVATMPGVLLLTGRVDDINVVAHNAHIGSIDVEKLTLQGEKLDVDFSALDKKDGSAVRSAQKLELVGVVKQQALEDMLAKRLEKVEDLQVAMIGGTVSASGRMNVLGRMADVYLEGTFIPKAGGLYFHMNNLEVRNSRLGNLGMNSLIGDVLLFDLHQSPIKADITDVQMQDEQVTITASYAGNA